MALLSNHVAQGHWAKRDEGDYRLSCCSDFDQHYQLEKASLAFLEQQAAHVDPEGDLINAIISFPVADGSAWYRVAKMSPLTLEHIPYGDAYRIPAAYIRGLTVADVRAMVSKERRLKEIFSRPQ